jgi:hypothetical protein
MDPNRLTAVPAYIRHARIREATLDRATEEMAGRTVWCVSGLAAGRSPARRLDELLRRLAGYGLAGRRRDLPGPSEEEDYGQAVRSSDEVVGRVLAPEDVVVIQDMRAAVLATPARERGAHVVWSGAAAPGREEQSRVRDFPSGGAVIDALILTARLRSGEGATVERVTVALPSDASITARDIPASREAAWLPLLADIVRSDRLETVGGRLHARPTVAVR